MTRSVFRFVTALLIFGAAAVNAQRPLLMPAPGSPVNVGPGSGQLLLADLDGDGHLDMVTRHLLELKLKLFRGDGKGGFTAFPRGEIRLSDQPGTIALADINNDGILDLLATRNHSDAVDIFVGDGKGGFTTAPGSPFTASASTATYTHGLFVLDLNEDGKLDLVTTNGKSHELGILFGDGRGRFVAASPVKLDLGRTQAFFAMGDVDEDGHSDLIAMAGSPDDMRPGTLRIWRGDGKGGFSPLPGSSLQVPPDPHAVMLAKLGSDGRQHIVSSHGGGYLSVLHNLGAGTFEPAPGSPYSINREIYGLVLADVNGDRQSDLIAATVDSVSVLLSDGRGFIPVPQTFRAGPGAYRVASGDLNNDGIPDVAASNFEGSAVTILLGQNSQRLARTAEIRPASPRRAAGR